MHINKVSKVSEARLKKLDSFTFETSKNHFIRNFLRNGRVMRRFFDDITLIYESPILSLISFLLENHYSHENPSHDNTNNLGTQRWKKKFTDIL